MSDGSVDETARRLLEASRGGLAKVEKEVYEHSYNIARSALLICFDRAEDFNISALVSVAMLHRLTIHALRDLEKANREKIGNALSALKSLKGSKPTTRKEVDDLHQAIMRRIVDVTDQQVEKQKS